MLEALAVRDFRLLWAARLGSNLGSWLLVVAVPAYVFDLTGSTIATGTAVVAETLPALLLGPLAGVFADRWQRRRTMVAVDLVRAGCVLGLLAVRGPGQLWLLYLAILAENAAWQFFAPARQALVPAVVGRGRRLAAANALDALADGAVRLAGAPAGGLLYAGLGMRAVVIADAATYLLSAAAIAMVACRAAPPSAVSATRREALAAVVAELRDGARHVTGDATLRGLLLVGGGFLTANGALTALLVPYVRLRLLGGARDLGWLLSALGAGYLLGAPLAVRLAGRVALRPLLCAVLAAIGGCFLVLFNLPVLWVDLLAIGLAGIPGAGFLLAVQTQVQRRTPDRLLGRVGASFLTAQTGAAVAGAALGGALGHGAGLPITLNVASATVLVAAVATRCLLPTEPPPAPSHRPRSRRRSRVAR
jgi:predicted MFS family arabinose efflux permease